MSLYQQKLSFSFVFLSTFYRMSSIYFYLALFVALAYVEVHSLCRSTLNRSYPPCVNFFQTCPWPNGDVRGIKGGPLNRCRTLKSKFVSVLMKDWQSCGEACTKTRGCDVWVFRKNGQCSMYQGKRSHCRLARGHSGFGTKAGYSGCVRGQESYRKFII